MERPSDKNDRERALRRYFYSLLPYWRVRSDGGLTLGVHEYRDDWLFCFTDFGEGGTVAEIERDDEHGGFAVQVSFDVYLPDGDGDAIYETLDDAKHALLAALPALADERVHDDAVSVHTILDRELSGRLHILLPGCSGSATEIITEIEERTWLYDSVFDDIERWPSTSDEDEAKLLAEEPLALDSNNDNVT